jgi:hypothetical protein
LENSYWYYINCTLRCTILSYNCTSMAIAGRHYMRFLIAVLLFLAAAGVADAFFLDGENARAVWQAASDEGQQIRYALDSFMTKRLFH